MRRISVVLPALFLLGIYFFSPGCGGEDATTPTDEEFQALFAGTVGDAGGEFADEDIVLTIPAGALDGDADLALFADTSEPPLGPDTTPVYRLTGLPEQLDSPVTLRIRHGGAPSDSLALFCGEIRYTDGDTTGDGSGLTWFHVVCRDSSGWAIASLPRGPAVLPEKQEPEIKFVIIDGIGHVMSEGGHFEIVFGRPQTEQHAAYLAEAMEWSYDQIYALGFHFGDQDTIYPLTTYILEPREGRTAEYQHGNWAKGVFAFHPRVFDELTALHQGAIHEVFHHAQQFYDPRPPTEWISLYDNQTWLDEATASWIEEKTDFEGDSVPLSLNNGVWTWALNNGLRLQSWQKKVGFGYAMSMFIKYLVDTQGEERVLELYEAFRQHGNAAAAVVAVADPPLESWLPDWHRLVVLGQIYGDATTPERWNMYPSIDEIVGGETEVISHARQLSDYGSAIITIEVTDELQPPAGGLGIVLDKPGQISVFGHRVGHELDLLTYAPDSLVVGNLPALLQTYDDFKIMVSRPTGTGPDYNGRQSTWIEMGLTEEVDFTRFETAIISSRYHAFWNDGEVPWQGLNFVSQEGVFNGTTYIAVWDSTDTQGVRFHGQMTLGVNPETSGLMNWSATSTWDYGDGTYNLYEMSGGAMTLDSESDNEMAYRAYDAGVCDVITRIYVKSVQEGVIDRELQSWICDDDSYLTIRIRDDD